MFYCQPQETGETTVRALVSLTPAESKRLIARGVAALPEVKRALERGIVIIGRGTTNAFVIEELTGDKVAPKSHYAAGIVIDGELCVVPAGIRTKPVVLRDGEPAGVSPAEALKEFREEDVFIKGANAVDPEGNAGVLAAGDRGGTIGEILPVLLPQGGYLIVPVGLEKLIPSVNQAAPTTGIFRYKYSTGLPAGLVPVPNALVVTEVQAFQVLTGVQAVAAAAGGIAGSEGAVVLSLAGGADQIDRALSLVREIKGEPPLTRPDARSNRAAAEFNYEARAQWQALHPSQPPKAGG